MILYNGSIAAASATFVGHYPYVFIPMINFGSASHCSFMYTWIDSTVPLYILLIPFFIAGSSHTTFYPKKYQSKKQP